MTKAKITETGYLYLRRDMDIKVKGLDRLKHDASKASILEGVGDLNQLHLFLISMIENFGCFRIFISFLKEVLDMLLITINMCKIACVKLLKG